MKQSFLVAAMVFSCTTLASAQLVSFNFDSQSAAPSFVEANLNSTLFQLSAGTATFPQGNPTTGFAISSSGWTGGSGARTWSFTLTADADVRFDLAGLAFDGRRSPTGPANWSVSINGSHVGSGNLSTADTWVPANIPLSGFGNLQSATVTLTGFGASNSAGTWRLDNVVLDGIALTPVPEPSTWALLGGGLVFLAAQFRRRA